MIFRSKTKNAEMELNTARFEKQFREAQKRLNILIVEDSKPYIPFMQGQLRGQVDYPDGVYGDVIRWYAPYAHYQYEGKLYVDPITGAGGFWIENEGWKSRRGVAKVESDRQLNYHTKDTGDHWFDRAKQTHLNEWIREVRRVGGGGV